MRGNNAKVFIDTHSYLRIATEYIQNGFTETPTPEERTTIREEIWEMQEARKRGTYAPN